MIQKNNTYRNSASPEPAGSTGSCSTQLWHTAGCGTRRTLLLLSTVVASHRQFDRYTSLWPQVDVREPPGYASRGPRRVARRRWPACGAQRAAWGGFCALALAGPHHRLRVRGCWYSRAGNDTTCRVWALGARGQAVRIASSLGRESAAAAQARPKPPAWCARLKLPGSLLLLLLMMPSMPVQN